MTTTLNKYENSGNFINIKVKYLDDHIECFTMNGNALGSDLYQKISIRMQLLESYFFGLQYVSLESDLCWLDLRKSIRKQTDYNNECSFEFCIKFYTPDPNLLHDHLTKKLFILQIKKDITNGELNCSESTKILLGGLFLQLQYLETMNLQLEDAERYLIHLFNDQLLTSEFMDQCLKFQQTLQCQTIIETHFDLLEIVRKIDFYGMKLHPAKDNEGLSLNLAVYHMGIVIFQKYTKINTFNWSKIRKLSFKRKRFLIKLHPEEYLELFVLWVIQGFYKDTLEFYFESRNSCKNFWKKCIEHHAFFRTQSNLTSATQNKSIKKYKFRRNFSGSRFRYIGLTQFELEHIQKESYQLDNLFYRSESAGRLTSPNPSFARLSRRSSETRYNSIHSLSAPIKPSISDSFNMETNDHEISQNHIAGKPNQSHWERRKNAFKNSKNHLQSELQAGKTLPKDRIENTDSLCSNDHEQFSFPSNGHKSIKYLPSASTSDETVPLSLINVPEPINNKDSTDCTFQNGDHDFDYNEYAFVPNILAQLSRSECSNSDISMSFHAIDISNTHDNSIYYTTDTLPPHVVLKCIEKDFLFNEFTHLKELKMLIKITNNQAISDDIIREMRLHLNQICISTTFLVTKLEQIIQFNIQSLTSSWEHIQQFLLTISEYCGQIRENIKIYIRELKIFITNLWQSNFSTNYFNSSQIENDCENETNFLRLFISPIIQQRAHLSCLSIFILFIPPDDKGKLICQELIVNLQNILITADGIEEFAHFCLVTNLIRNLCDYDNHGFEGFTKNPINRIGWLQKLSNKGASNRLFILLSDQLICAKKIPSSNFVVEHRWFIRDIQVGTISDMTNVTNGYDPSLSPFDSITIMLWDPGESVSRYSSVVLLADTNKSRSIWIESIKKSASACSVAQSNSNHSSQDIINKNNFTNNTKFWTEKYRLIDICWHERVSISQVQMKFLFQFSLSAYLLRKYKSSNNWQRLWVVLTDCHLYFYHNHNNQQAITSLCLVGFQISEPTIKDSITKLWVIKLEKELKTCFLRTENQYFYHRWRTALSFCTFSNPQ